MTKAASVDNLAKSDCFSSVLHPDKDVHHIVQDDGHTVVEQRLAKDQVVEVRVHSNLDEKFDFLEGSVLSLVLILHKTSGV